jgi:plasmid stability protein
MKPLFKLLLLAILSLPFQALMAWDSVGHRLSAAVAMEFLSNDSKAQLLTILEQHPRFEADFLAQMPGFIDTSDDEQMLVWLLGQAAFWPDLARSLGANAAQHYNHPPWHYIDGAWVRGAVSAQGNIYVGVASFADIDGADAASIRTEQQADNIITALDYNTTVLADDNRAPAERAVALCWVLHLIADIHQPLHTGSLFSAGVFKRGDRGGNGIATDAGNLHSRWDRSLSAAGLVETLPLVLQELAAIAPTEIQTMASDWSQWMAESREILLTNVYTEVMRTEIAAADRSGRRLPTSPLASAYVTQMQDISRQRIGLAGLRLAIWIENNLIP